MNGRRRCVITGIGVISPLGNTLHDFYEALRRGESAIREMTEWENGPFENICVPGSPVRLDETMIRSIPRASRRSMSRISLHASFAAQQAAADAGLTPEDLKDPRTGCIIGSTMGGTSAVSESYHVLYGGGGLSEMPAMQFFKSVSHTAAFNVSHYLGITGVVQAPCAACASALQAIGQARDLVASGVQDVVLCGGAEELAPEVPGSFAVISAGFSSGPGDDISRASRPFDASRKGLVCGEGAGILVVESLDHALARGARIYAEITGYATCGCGNAISQSDAPSIMRCLEAVCSDAGIGPADVDYVNAHATSTLQGDRAEAEALTSFFPSRPPVSSLKGHIGHTLGASGSLELAASLEMMRRSELLPTLNLETPGEGCEKLDHVYQVTPKKLRRILKNSFAFGGINAAVICTAFDS